MCIYSKKNEGKNGWLIKSHGSTQSTTRRVEGGNLARDYLERGEKNYYTGELHFDEFLFAKNSNGGNAISRKTSSSKIFARLSRNIGEKYSNCMGWMGA